MFIYYDFIDVTIEYDTEPNSYENKLQPKETNSDITKFPVFMIPPLLIKSFSGSYGWSIYNKVDDFRRMCGKIQDRFVQLSLNSCYKVWPTYPDILFVPKTLDVGKMVAGSTLVRSRGRFPVLSYYYAAKNTCVLRCAQPVLGIFLSYFQDAKLLKLVAEMKGSHAKLHIFDARPRLNAMANLLIGKGYEIQKIYDFCTIEFMNIPNIHVVRDSLNRYLEVTCIVSDSVSSLWGSIYATQWPDYIVLIIKAACDIAWKLHFYEENCLVHCSDGWDRTSQLCALVSLLLDPFYRTLQGFIILIEKEFVSFGHKFCDRIGLQPGKPDEVSPIFFQFLECVYQLSQKYPNLFQFNEDLLLTIAYHLTSCEFGTFLVNSEAERVAYCLAGRTVSLWNYILSKANDYISLLYDNEPETFVEECSFEIPDFEIWVKFYRPSILYRECQTHIFGCL